MSTAQYVVDIASQMPEGAKTAAQLDDVAAKLDSAGLGAEHMADAVALAERVLAFIEAAQQCGYPRNDDFNGAVQEGAGFYQTTMRKGVRASTAAERAAAGIRPASLSLCARSRSKTFRVLSTSFECVGFFLRDDDDHRNRRVPF